MMNETNHVKPTLTFSLVINYKNFLFPSTTIYTHINSNFNK